MLSEVRQSLKDKYWMILLLCGVPRRVKSTETESRKRLTSGGRKEEWGMSVHWGQSFGCKDENVLEIGGGDGCTTV